MENLQIIKQQETEKFKNEFIFDHSINYDSKIGNIIPFFNFEVIPGDIINLKYKLYAKSAPLISPLYNFVDNDVRFFYVPHRLSFKKFNEWIIYNNDESSQMPHLYMNIEESDKLYQNYGNLLHALGIPWQKEYKQINLLLWRAYNKIFYHYYLNLNILPNHKKNEIKDWAYLDDTDIYTNFINFVLKDAKYNPTKNNRFDGFHIASLHDQFTAAIKRIDNLDAIYVGNTLNELWRNEAIQKNLNRIEITLNKFKNYIYNLFGIKMNDINEPVYLGGGKEKFFINEIYATSETDNHPLGSFAGKAESLNNNIINFVVPEYGTIFGIHVITPEIHRAWITNKLAKKMNPIDFYNPDLDGHFIDHIRRIDLDSRTQNYEHDIIANSEPYYEYKTTYNKVFGEMAKTLLNWNFTDFFGSKDIYQFNFCEIYNKIDNGNNNNAANYWYTLANNIYAVPSESHFFNRCEINLSMKRNIKKFEF